ncbi:MAG: coproporphyrinogen III oxidase, partial [Clostridia bacterium]|nr:coproporphyrinogen III oxidase [Clostridia bacterium]
MIVNNTKKGIYVHIPFCLKKCNYCDFYSLPSYNCVGDYVDALCMNIDSVAKDNDMIEIDSIFVGGGTPSSIDGEYIQ